MMQQQPPSPIPIQLPRKRRWYNDKDLFWHGFIRSNYVTAFTDWFMGLAGKLAEFVLYLTVLYSGAELYPGVNLPAGLNLSVFLLQLGALDVGGIGLNKLAKQARADGNMEGAAQAEHLSRWLIRIMIAGIVTVSAEQVISRLALVQAARPAIQIVQAAVELVLVIARSICAVLYGKVIHALKPGEQAPLAPPVLEVEQTLIDLATRLDTDLSTIRVDTKRQIDTLAQQLDKVSARHLSPELAAVNRQVDTLTARLSQLVQQLDSLDTRLTHLEVYQGEQWTHLEQSIQATLREMRQTGRYPVSRQGRLSMDQRNVQEHGTRLDSQRIENGLDTETTQEMLSRQGSPTGKIIRLSRREKSSAKQPLMTERILEFIRTNHREPSLAEIQSWGCAKQTAVNSREAARALLQREAQQAEQQKTGNEQVGNDQ
jgi:hypothetical protein